MLSSMARQSKGPLIVQRPCAGTGSSYWQIDDHRRFWQSGGRVRVSSILDSEARCKGPLLVFDISADEVGVPSCKKLEPRRQKELKVGLIGNALGNSHFDVS